MIDFHCHLDLYPDPASVIRQADKEGVYVLAVTTTPKAWQINQNLLKGCSRIKAAVGLHPEVVFERYQEIDILFSIMKETRYVGEIGIDGSLQHKSSLDLQCDIFRRILSRCSELGGKVMSIHSRSASKEVLNALEEYPQAGIPVLHWFSGTDADLSRAIHLGCWFSIGPGMLRFKKGQSITKSIPQDRILTESDGPFVLNGTQPLMPWDLKEAEKFLAEIWHVDVSSAQIKIRNNFQKLISSVKNLGS